MNINVIPPLESKPLGRPKKKPDYDAEAVLDALIEAVIESYNSPDDEQEHKPIKLVAEEFGITPLKVRKLLITGEVYKTPVSECHRARIMRKRRATKLTLMGSKSLVAQEFVRNAQKSCRFEIN